MRDFLRFLRYAAWYLIVGPARSGIALVTRPLFLVGTTAVSLVLTLTADSPRAGETYETLRAISPLGSMLGSTVVLWSAAAGFVLGTFILTLGVVAVGGLIRGAVNGARLVSKAWRVAPLIPWRPTGIVEQAIGCQITDLHLCRRDAVPYELEETPALWPGLFPDGAEVARRASAVIGAAADASPGVLFFTGDLTDRGDAFGWQEFETLRQWCGAAATWIVPGNHDISFNPHDQPDYLLKRFAHRRSRFEAAARKPLNRRSYPEISSANGVSIVCLSSVEHRSDNLLTNAVGKFGDGQIRRFEVDLEPLTGPVLVLCHHHLGPISQKKFSFAELLMSAVDAPRLLAVLAAYSRRNSRNQVLVIHGHKHVQTYGRLVGANVFVAGLPSSTLGEQDEAGRFDGIPVFARVGFDRGGAWDVELHRLCADVNQENQKFVTAA